MREEPISDENKEQIRLDDDENVPSDIVQTQDGKYGVFGIYLFSHQIYKFPCLKWQIRLLTTTRQTLCKHGTENMMLIWGEVNARQTWKR